MGTGIKRRSGGLPHEPSEQQGAIKGLHASENESLLSTAVYAGNVEWLRELIADGANVNARDGFDDDTLLHVAASRGNGNVARLLIEAGADTSARDKYHCTPLLRAALNEAGADVVRALIEGGAEVNACDDLGCSPLHQAASAGQAHAVRLLIEAGADVNARRSADQTALHLAASGGHKHVIGVLITAGADVNAHNEYGETPLYQASFEGDVEGSRVLIRAGADINAKNKENQTPLDAALQQGHERLAALLRMGGETKEKPEEHEFSNRNEMERDSEIESALQRLVKLGGAAASRRGLGNEVAIGHIERQIVDIGEGLLELGDVEMVDAVYGRLERIADTSTLREVTLAWKGGLVGWTM